LAVPDISEIIQAAARQRGRGETGPLIMLRQLDGAPGERISHLPVESELAQAWVALTGQPFRPHQAQALTALRRGEPVALAAASADVAMTAFLMLYAVLLAEPQAAALLLAPDEPGAQAAHADLARLNEALPQILRLPIAWPEHDRRLDHYARVVIATPQALHGRLLRHHDRAWRLFWPRLRLLLLPDLQRYTGVAGAHLTDLLLRAQRVATAHSGSQYLSILATMTPCADPGPALKALLGQPWRVIAADDDPSETTTLAVWRGGGSRLREAAELATTIRRQGYHVHIACEPLESALLAPIVGDVEGITWGPAVPGAHALIAAGYPGSLSTLRRMLRAGHQAVVLVLGDLPHEQAIARQPETLLAGPPSSWPAPAPNAYVTAQHVLCAASELPLTEEEVVLWGAQDIVARLVAQGQLVDLPDPEVAWKPTSSAGEPYAEFSMLAASGGAITARLDQGQVAGTLDPTGFERWTFPGAALPPGAGGFRVLMRDEESGSVSLRIESNGRRTYPLRRCQVAIRDERATRALAGGRQIGWGRVVVDEQIYGYREAKASAAPADMALQPPLTARWAALACWFDVGIGDHGGPAGQVLGQFAGWSLAAALPLRAQVSFTEVVPCYDHEARRLYLVDAQPGGSGLAAWVYAHAEELLPLAYDVALACRGDPLLEPLSRADQDWLLALLGRTAEQAGRTHQPEPARTGQIEFIEGPPPATPQPILTPAPPDQRPHGGSHERPGQRPAYGGAAAPPGGAKPAPGGQGQKTKDEGRAGDQPPYGDTADRRAEPPPVRRPPAPASRPEPQRPEPGQRELPFDERRPAPPQGGKPERPARPAPPQGGKPAEDAPPDPAALIARLRRQREQREQREQRQGGRQPPRRPAMREPSDVEPRFAAGDRIFCLPYGDGIVKESRIEDGREVLLVNFPNHGDLTIDPAVNFVRKQEGAPEEDDLL
jgi:DEAD/DEAH box helicase domain-containing protein